MTDLRTVEQIDAELAQAHEALKNVKGTETEVYARIVGYYRSVRNWNKGKRDEYDLRKQFVWEDNKSSTNSFEIQETVKVAESNITEKPYDSEIVGDIYYEYFSRRTCPNCQPVKKHLETLDAKGIQIDVDTPEGLERASKFGVLSAPTVIMFDSTGTEKGRAHNISELKEVLSAKCECVA